MLLCTWRLCDCKWLDVLKHLLHSEHLYGLSPVWTLMWQSSCPDSLNALSCGCSVISLLSASIFTSKQLSPVYITTWHAIASNQHWMTSYQCDIWHCDGLHSNCNIYTCDNQLDTTSSCHSVVVDDTTHCCSSLSLITYYLCDHGRTMTLS